MEECTLTNIVSGAIPTSDEQVFIFKAMVVDVNASDYMSIWGQCHHCTCLKIVMASNDKAKLRPACD